MTIGPPLLIGALLGLLAATALGVASALTRTPLAARHATAAGPSLPNLSGLDLVDSYVFNPHKWLLTNVDCSVFYVADRAPLLATMSILPPYLRGAATGSSTVVDYRDWHVALGRRFRSLKLWWVLRAYGSEGLRSMIREHVRLAQEFSSRVTDHPSLELVAPVPFSLVCFRHLGGDDATARLANAINRSGHSYVTPSVLEGKSFIRVSIGQARTNATHVDRLWELVAAEA